MADSFKLSPEERDEVIRSRLSNEHARTVHDFGAKMRKRHRAHVREWQRGTDRINRGYRVFDFAAGAFFLFAAWTNTGSNYGTAGLVVLGVGMLFLALEPKR